MFFEKQVRKRTYAKTSVQKQRIKKVSEQKRTSDSMRGRVFEESLFHRESKMRRFCNYFVTLFHQKKLNPFSQFVSAQVLKDIKQKVRDKMNYYPIDDNAIISDPQSPNS
jgi:predicted ABC-class ATPase